MKHNHITIKIAAFMLLCIASVGVSFAQAPKEIRIKLERNENGVVKSLDTTFTNVTQQQVEEYLKQNGWGGVGISDDEMDRQIIIEKGISDGNDEGINKEEMNRQILIEKEIDGGNGDSFKTQITITETLGDESNGELLEKQHCQKIVVTDANGNQKEIFWIGGTDGLEMKSSADCHSGSFTCCKVIICNPEECDLEKVEKSFSQESKNLNASGLSVYPNPNNGKFQLQFTLKDKKPVTIKVLDLSGREVYSETINDFNGSYNNEIILPSQQKGVLLLSISQNGKQVVKKLEMQ